MKKILLPIFATVLLFACTNQQAETTVDKSISTVSRIDDNYSYLAKKHIADDYTKNDYTKFDEIVSDSVKAYFNSTVPLSKSQWKELAQLHHVYFDSINWDKNFFYVKTDSVIKDEKHENNIIKAGSIFTSMWYNWNAIGKTTRSKVTNPGYVIFQWKNNKIITARFSFDPAILINEMTAAEKMKK